MYYPFGAFTYYDKDTDKTHLQFSYVDMRIIILKSRSLMKTYVKGVKFDVRNGIIEKQTMRGSNY